MRAKLLLPQDTPNIVQREFDFPANKRPSGFPWARLSKARFMLS